MLHTSAKPNSRPRRAELTFPASLLFFGFVARGSNPSIKRTLVVMVAGNSRKGRTAAASGRLDNRYLRWL